jgi:hypothetical protein
MFKVNGLLGELEQTFHRVSNLDLTPAVVNQETFTKTLLGKSTA